MVQSNYRDWYQTSSSSTFHREILYFCLIILTDVNLKISWGKSRFSIKHDDVSLNKIIETNMTILFTFVCISIGYKKEISRYVLHHDINIEAVHLTFSKPYTNFIFFYSSEIEKRRNVITEIIIDILLTLSPNVLKNPLEGATIHKQMSSLHSKHGKWLLLNT